MDASHAPLISPFILSALARRRLALRHEFAKFARSAVQKKKGEPRMLQVRLGVAAELIVSLRFIPLRLRL
jgi:hypothetical protein